MTIVKGPLEAILGIVYGLVFGVIMWYIPHKKHVGVYKTGSHANKKSNKKLLLMTHQYI